MKHIFMERNSAYESIRGVSYLHSLFECSNSNQPSYVSSIALTSYLHNLAMFITHVSKISRKLTEMALEEMNLHAHVAT